MRAVAILHIPDSPFGAVRMVYGDLARTLAARGDTLDVLTPERFRLVARLHPRWWVLLLPFAAAFWLWRRRRRYDVALFHSYAGWVFNLLPSGVPSITQFHGLEPLFYSALSVDHRAQGRRLSTPFRFVYGWLMPRVLRSTCRRSRMVTCLNGTEQRYLLEHGWSDADRLVLMRQGVHEGFFVNDRQYAPRATRILAVSQWLPTKGVGFLAEAFAGLAQQHADLQLWCYGTRVPAALVLESFPPAIRERVTVVEEVEHHELASVMRRADLYVHASLSEGSGRAIMEALASALPVVVTPVGLVPDLLEDGRDGVIVPKRDSRALHEGIASLIDDVNFRRKLGENARRVAEIFSPTRCDAEHADLVRAVAKPRM